MVHDPHTSFHPYLYSMDPATLQPVFESLQRLVESVTFTLRRSTSRNEIIFVISFFIKIGIIIERRMQICIRFPCVFS